MDRISELDKQFSLYIRLVYADFRELVHCYTCTWVGHYTEADAGHFNKRGNFLTRFDENNVRPQCRDCNRHMDGRPDIFEEELRDEVGDEEVDRIIQGKYEEARHTDFDFDERITRYKGLVKQMQGTV